MSTRSPGLSALPTTSPFAIREAQAEWAILNLLIDALSLKQLLQEPIQIRRGSDRLSRTCLRGRMEGLQPW